jgi:hypothetical protein
MERHWRDSVRGRDKERGRTNQSPRENEVRAQDRDTSLSCQLCPFLPRMSACSARREESIKLKSVSLAPLRREKD